MSSIKSVNWLLEPHTKAKHLILKSYLDAWIPILSSWNKKILYVDGFAGPGEYENGEDGSPVIAIKAVRDHTRKIKSKVVMIFIENNEKRIESLKRKIEHIDNKPANIDIIYNSKKFSDLLIEILDYLEEQKKQIAPAFVFIDPFGFKDIPFKVIKRIMENEKCEVFITFMYEEINRFMVNPKNHNILSETFGTSEWKKALELKDSQEKIKYLGGIYRKQMKEDARIKYVLEFSMINKFNKYDYLLFFGTNHIEGLKAMKNAMWKVDPYGNFKFSDFTNNPNQPYLINPGPDLNKLENIVLSKFKKSTVNFGDLAVFIWVETPFLEKHLREVLVSFQKMENKLIEVITNEKRRINVFKNYYKIRFL